MELRRHGLEVTEKLCLAVYEKWDGGHDTALVIQKTLIGALENCERAANL